LEHSITSFTGKQLRAHVIEGRRRDSVDGGNQTVERPIKTIQDIVLEFIIINCLSCGSKFRGISFHLGDVLLSCHIHLLGVGKSTAKGGNTRLGLCGVHGMQGLPHINSMMKAEDLRQHILGEGVHQKTDHLLILCNPGIIGRVRYRYLLLVFIFNLQIGGRDRFGSLEESHETSTTQHGQDLSLPIQKILASELHGGRSTNWSQPKRC
jgi:hypothetical protein